jgi:N-acetylmuramoyl-L-alanine amidase
MNFFKTILNFLHNLFFGNNNPIVQDEEEPETVAVTEGEKENYIEENEADNDVVEEAEDNIETVSPVACGATSKMKILIDNGHGNNTPGKRSPYSANNVLPAIEFYEYKWNREIAEKIVEQLVEKGYDAELIVTEENDISLKERVKRVNDICKGLGASNVILLSIHANAAGMGDEWKTARGWCAYTTKGVTRSDALAECLYDEAEKNFVDLKIRKDLSDGDRDWESDFYIIKNTKCPAVLTENFFYDNVDDVQYILSEEGRKAVIKTHVDGVIKYIKSL